MRVRGSVVAVALALVAAALAGAGLGRVLGGEREQAPDTFAALPIPASSPSYPVTPAEVDPDDPYPALAADLRTRPVRVGSPPFQVELPIPRGWFRSDATSGEWRWYPAPDRTKNLYFVRVSQVGQNHQPVPSAVGERISALRDAADVDDFELEAQEDDRFVASHVAGRHLRLNYEGYLPRDGAAYLRIAVIGREADRDGLAALFERLMAQTRV